MITQADQVHVELYESLANEYWWRYCSAKEDGASVSLISRYRNLHWMYAALAARGVRG